MPCPFEAVIFDNDGLLLDTETAWTRAEQDLFERYGREFTMEHKRAMLGNSKGVAEAKLESMLGLPGQGARLLAELEELVMEEALAGVPPRPGSRNLLNALLDADTKVGLASNSSRLFVERTLEVSGIPASSFAVLITADDVAHPKPAPDIYLAACSGLDADPARSAALEDSQPGISSARAAGLFVIGVPYFEDQTLEGASLMASSLADPRVGAALGLAPER
ncbi:MAG TPA: HAD family phosphatase [Thermoleophilaceae bacterium]|nr:HAD family phosphatase [Thermoleophilaceae bacterium]